MLAPITKRYTDHSATDSFSFSFHCDKCGKEWRSETYVFNTESFPKTMDENVRNMLWNQQHDAAYERANRDAAFEFNRCPKCARRVCFECFYVSETEPADVCRDCAKESGP